MKQEDWGMLPWFVIKAEERRKDEARSARSKHREKGTLQWLRGAVNVDALRKEKDASG